MGSREVRAGRAFVEIVARDGLSAGLARAAATLRGFSGMVAGLGAAVTGVTGTIFGGLAAAVQQFSTAGDAIEKMAGRTGLSAEAVSELAYAADLSGTNVEDLEKGVRKMQQTIAAARDGNEAALESLRDLGVNMASLADTPDAQLAVFAERIAAIEDPAARTAAAMSIFGKGGTKLLPLLADGAEGLRAMRNEAAALGLTVSTDTAGRAAQLNDALGRVTASAKAIAFNLGAAVAPAVTEFANRAAVVIGRVVNWIKANEQLVVQAVKVVAVVAAAGTALMSLGIAGAVASVAIGGLAGILTAVTAAATAIGGAIGSALAALATPIGVATVAIVALGAALLKFTATGQAITDAFGAAFGELGGIATETWGKVVAAFKVGDLRGVATAIGDGMRQAFDVVRELFGSLATIGTSAWSKLTAATADALAGVQAAWGRARNWLLGTWQSLVTSAGELWARLVSVVETAVAALPGALSATWQSITSTVHTAVAAVPGLLQAAWRGLGGIAESAFSVIPDKLQPALAAVGAFGQSVLGSLASAFATVGQVISTGLKAGIATAQSLMSAWLGPLWSMLVDGAASLGSQISAGVDSAFSGIGASLSQVPGEVLGLLSEIPGALPAVWDHIVGSTTKLVTDIGAAMQGLGDVLQNPWQAVRDGVSRAVSGLTSTWESGLTQLPGFLQPVVSGLAAIASAAFQPFVTAASFMVDTIGSVMGDLVSVVTAPIGAIMSLQGDLWKSLPSLFGALPAVAGTAWEAIKAGVGGVGDFIQSVFGTAWSFMQEGFALTVQTARDYLSSIGQAFTDLGQGIMSTFSEVVADAGLAWDGISAALAIGEWRQAWDIAWTQIQLTFFKAVQPLQLGWSEFTTGLASLLDGAIVAVRTSWNNVTTWIASSIMRLLGMLQEAIAKVAEFDPTGMAGELSASLSVDVSGALAVLEEERKRFEQDLNRARNARDSERAKGLSERQDQITSRITALEQTRNQLADAAKQQAGGARIEDKVREHIKSLLDPLAAAGDGSWADVSQLVGQANAGSDSLAKAADPIGTFSAQAAQLMAYGFGKTGEEKIVEQQKEQLAKMDEQIRATERISLPVFTGAV